MALNQINAPHVTLILHVTVSQLVHALIEFVLAEETIISEYLVLTQRADVLCQRIASDIVTINWIVIGACAIT